VHDAGVANENVQAAELLDGLVDRCLHLVPLRDVGADRQGAPSQCVDLLDRRRCRPIAAQLGATVLMRCAGDTIDIGDRHVGTLGGQGERDAASNSTRSAGHQSYLPLQSHFTLLLVRSQPSKSKPARICPLAPRLAR
jgi:hypothetical protein